ncbi:hypothetical protein MSG28_000642 [Choristoneura fumiferana]|uniref:Uncharacterized protein n=1 Tax=Choristoneura fumiferana TaxID=7141 RepID=A0ACC0K1T7_CHOFU|nr:hypothetical protein MSG28_000642 [Choristoneura fumiferana]
MLLHTSSTYLPRRFGQITVAVVTSTRRVPPSPSRSMCLCRVCMCVCMWSCCYAMRSTVSTGTDSFTDLGLHDKKISTRNDSFTDHGIHDKHIKVEGESISLTLSASNEFEYESWYQALESAIENARDQTKDVDTELTPAEQDTVSTALVNKFKNHWPETCRTGRETGQGVKVASGRPVAPAICSEAAERREVEM